jgi:hypothetical protein
MPEGLPLPTDIVTKLIELHYGFVKGDRERPLPHALLMFAAEQIGNLYESFFYRPALKSPNDVLKPFLTAATASLNSFRNSLPDVLFERRELGSLVERREVDLTQAYSALARGFGSIAHLFPRDSMYPVHLHQDIVAGRKPYFSDWEPDDSDERRQWRRDKRSFENAEIPIWQDRVKLAQKLEKTFEQTATPLQKELVGTPFFFHASAFPTPYVYEVPFHLPDEHRFAHQFVRAPSRSGKTNFMICEILEDLKKVEEGNASLIVMESHGAIVPHLAKLKTFGPGGPLEGKLLNIEPLEYEMSLNIFDKGKHDDLTDREQTALYRDVLSTISFFINSIVRTDMSGQQDIVLNLLIQAMLTLPSATVHDLRKLLTKKGFDEYKGKFVDADPFVIEAIELDLFGDFKQSTQAMRSRATGILTDPLFRKSFSHAEDRLDLFDELKTPKVILVDTGGLGQATQAFGRFFLAKLHQAMLKRRQIARREPNITKPSVYLYVDEAIDYIKDEPLISTMIDTVGKDGLGMTFATQREAHLSADVLDALKRVYIQCVPRRPIVNVVFDPTEPPEPPRTPIVVSVAKMDWDEHPQMSVREQLAIRQQMKERFGPIAPQVDLSSTEPELDAQEEPVTPTATPEPPPATAPEMEDETDAKPWNNP